MKFTAEMKVPAIPVRNGLTCGEISLDKLEESGLGLVTFGLNNGDVFEFPDTIDDIKIAERQVRAGSTAMERMILGLKNGKPAWLSIANLRRWDADMKPVHAIAEYCRNAQNDRVRVEMMLGKKIKADGDTTFQVAKFDNGVRTDERETRTTANLIFA